MFSAGGAPNSLPTQRWRLFAFQPAVTLCGAFPFPSFSPLFPFPLPFPPPRPRRARPGPPGPTSFGSLFGRKRAGPAGCGVPVLTMWHPACLCPRGLGTGTGDKGQGQGQALRWLPPPRGSAVPSAAPPACASVGSVAGSGRAASPELHFALGAEARALARGLVPWGLVAAPCVPAPLPPRVPVIHGAFVPLGNVFQALFFFSCFCHQYVYSEAVLKSGCKRACPVQNSSPGGTWSLEIK